MKTQKDIKPPHLQGWVVIGKEERGNAYQAVIERSFSMDLSGDHCLFFWIGEAVSNLGTRHSLTHDLVKKNAEKFCDLFNGTKGMKFELFDVHSPDLPIVIDWDTWREASEPSDKTLSGVRSKYLSRNPPFRMKEEIDK